jgi:hypothetical protein
MENNREDEGGGEEEEGSRTAVLYEKRGEKKEIEYE